MSRSLYINDRLLDLDDETIIALTFQVNDIADVESRQANYSNQFSLPATNENIKNLQFSNKTASNTAYPYRQNKCNYFQNGVQLIQNGVLIIDGFDGVNFAVTVYSGIYDFFTLIDGKTLKEFNWATGNNFIWGASHIVSREQRWNFPKEHPNHSDVCVPIANYGTGFVADYRYMYAAMRYVYMLQKIVDWAGYTMSGEILEDEIAYSLALTLSTNQQYDTDAVLLARSFKGGLSTRVSNSLFGYLIINLLGVHRNFSLDGTCFNSSAGSLIIDSSLPDFSYTAPELQALTFANSVSKTRYRSISYNSVTVDINLHFNNTLVDPTKQDPAGNHIFLWYLQVYKNGAYYKMIEMPGNGAYGEYQYSDSFSVDLIPGDEIQIRLLAQYIDLDLKYTPSGIDATKSFISFTATNTTKLDLPVDFNSLVPATPLKDFVKTFCNLFGLTIISEDYNLRFIKAKEITKGVQTLAVRDDTGIFLETPVFEDWSDKLDLSKTISVQYRIGSYGQSNEFKYAVDTNTNGYGDAIMSVDDTTLPVKSVMFELPYSSALPYEYTGIGTSVFIPAFTKYEADEWSSITEYSEDEEVSYGGTIWTSLTGNLNVIPGSNSGVWQQRSEQYILTESSNNCLVLIRKCTATGLTNRNVAYFNDTTRPISLNFQYLIQEYYSELSSMLNRHKSVDCYLRLSEADINNLDFTKVKYIKYFGDFFYLNTVNEYIEGQSTSCKLIRI